MQREAAIDLVRGFNRFYTRQLGLLDEGLLGSEFTLTESRVLYELANRHALTATEIARELGIDLGYLSRVLKRFERKRYIKRTRSPADARQSRLELTRKGLAVFDPLNRAARAQIAAMIDPMSPEQRRELLASMGSVQSLIAPGAGPHEREGCVLRPLRIGDLGWIAHRQGILYAQEYGWDGSYEALAAEILAGFVKNFDPDSEASWIAEQGGTIVGSVFLVRGSESSAKLRLLYVEPAARGAGLGRRLVQQCIEFARAKRYATLMLWTNDVLASARRIYESAGFRLVKEERHHSFGKELVGQTWELTLSAGAAAPD
jgi:DNA-binding MarR family transcriptional regulator/GNAT superfamily N-acetyltransferase